MPPIENVAWEELPPPIARHRIHYRPCHRQSPRHRYFGLTALTLILLIVGLVLPASVATGDDQLTGSIHVGGRPRYGPGAGKDGSGNYPDALPLYHNGDTVVCSDCHIMHASQTHYYDPSNPAPGEEVPYSGGANPSLLKAADSLDLCLSCHDGQTFAPDVLGADVNGLTDRSAGHFDEPDVDNPRGHDLGRNLASGGFNLCMRCHWSSPEDQLVTCVDCHNPHGNNVARNLQWASDPASTPDLGLFVNPAASGMARYEAANVSYGTLNSVDLREASNMCIDCHHVFSGESYIDPDGNGIHNRHPAYDSERNSTNTVDQGAAGGTTNPAHWEGGTGSGFWNTPRLRFVNSGASDFAAATVVDASTNGVFCLSCHRGHGGDYAFSLNWELESFGYGAPGCDQCHLIADEPQP